MVAVPLVVAEPVRVTSDSMAPTLHEGDHVLVDKVSGSAHDPGRRDVIAFNIPGVSGLVIKRVVGVAGDTVGLDNGQLVVNGHRVREPFVDLPHLVGTYYGPVHVPKGTVFTMGDNRGNSIDSRRFGPVPLGHVLGRVLCVIWPA
ncbi:MAG: signal peptidase [Pseudonocardiales bacterium]|nr:signal peptidase [Pseudonocardiales bacterium]MDT4951297.1 signal peptidase [Pseudonocardiales bacterium]